MSDEPKSETNGTEPPRWHKRIRIPLIRNIILQSLVDPKVKMVIVDGVEVKEPENPDESGF